MSPNRAAKKASALLQHDISARVLPDGTVELGWDHPEIKVFGTGIFNRHARFVNVFDVMGSGPNPETALVDLIEGMAMEEWVPVDVSADT